MRRVEETEISKTIISAYHEQLSDRIVSDVLIVGAGPSGLMAAFHLARKGYKVTIFEKRLSPGGGVWGGGMAMAEAVVQDEALPLLDEVGIRHQPRREGLHTASAIELAAGLCFHALQAGAVMFNLTIVEDVCVHQGRVAGLVANRSLIAEELPIDPITFSSKAAIDATGHEAIVVAALRRRRLLPTDTTGEQFGEGPMDASAGEAFVVENVAEVFPGLWVTGMSVCAALGGPRMGPIFGGMLLSGQRVAELIAAKLSEAD
ncbi:MAG: thiazole biosynthesis protein [Phycisphaerae bacterium]|nr:thiazole biosynthesis protein [Phycisphaerae bacterium]